MASSGTRIRASRPHAPGAAGRASSALVFVADDALRAAIVELLGDDGWTVREASTAPEARKAITEEHPAVLVADPGLCTDDLEGLVTSLDDRQSAPAVVVVSDLGRAAAVARAHHVIFLREPFDLEELLDAVHRAREQDARPSLGRRAQGD